MNSNLFKFLGAVLLSVLLISSSLFSENKENNRRLAKTQGSPVMTKLNINNLSTYVYNTGNSDIDAAGNSGLEFPKGSRKTAMFQSGLIWGAKYDGEVRVGGSAYRQGLQPGKIISYNNAESTDLPKNRIYRVRPDYKTGDLSGEAKDEGVTVSAVYDQYDKDWNEWPATDGAPFDDVDKNGVYDPAVDIPGVKGASQTVWYVANDLDASNTTNMYGANPLGIEMQATMWAYSTSGALGNMFFRKYIIINKSDKPFTDMYVSMWADPDLGDASDDFAGCDTNLSLGYVYNANARDAVYGDTPPPAAGFDFFQGPVIPGEPTDSAIFLGKRIYGKKNLPMTAFYYFARGDQNVVDPTQGDYQGSLQFYNFMRGRIGLTGDPFKTPDGVVTTYALPGDPTTQTGWVDGQIIGPDDRRIGSASGPFTMAVGDTQEIVVAEICAGALPGTDRLSAIGLLKFYDQQAQLAYDNFFDLPAPPPSPNLSVAEMNKKLILDWSEDNNAVKATEDNNSKGFAFEGYNIYQLPTASATLSEAKRIATYDIKNGVGKVINPDFDPSSGVVMPKVWQFGNDVGVMRYFEVTQDYINNTPLVNGIKYYFAVTAYSYNPDPNAVPNNLESKLEIKAIVPHNENPGVRYPMAFGDTVAVQHSAGKSEGVVYPVVIDPTRLKETAYKVTFENVTETDGDGNSHDVTYWNLVNTATNEVVLSRQSNQSGDDNYAVVNGLMIKVQGPPPGMKEYHYSGTRTITFAGTGSGGNWGSEGYGGAIGNAFDQWFSSSTVTYDQLKNVELRFANADTAGNFDVNQPNVSYGYRYMRGAAADPARPEFAPYILNAVSGYSFQEFAKNVPLAAYDVETNTRLAVGFLENNAINAVLDGKYFPVNHDAAYSDNIAAAGPREWLFIFNKPYQETQDAELAVDILNTTVPMMWFLTVNRRFDVPFTTNDVFEIVANHVNVPGDEFTFTSPGVKEYVDSAKADIKMINVFPNPYYGVNPEELNKYQRFVTFNHLPREAKIRIYNLAGSLIKTINKNTPTQFERWDLANEAGLPVPSGIYIAHIDMPGLGAKILKVAIIQEQQILDRF